MVEERILITVKTYPTLSRKYVETVCTAGINDSGSWRRLYPIRFRYLDGDKKFNLYDIIQVKLEDHSADGRPESRRPHTDTIRVVDSITDWSLRHQWVKPTIVESLQAMQEQAKSIGPVVCQEVLDFESKKVSGNWSESQIDQLRQQQLWGNSAPTQLEKIPWEFRIRWRDGCGHEHNHMFISWEVCETWRKYRHRYTDPIKRMKDKWLEDIFSQDRYLAFFMGNAYRFRNNYMICGTYNPLKSKISHESLF
ncbi:MAG: hypothetical protein Kow00105_02590 [Phycisphaeraceae bacterium]